MGCSSLLLRFPAFFGFRPARNMQLLVFQVSSLILKWKNKLWGWEEKLKIWINYQNLKTATKFWFKPTSSVGLQCWSIISFRDSFFPNYNCHSGARNHTTSSGTEHVWVRLLSRTIFSIQIVCCPRNNYDRQTERMSEVSRLVTVTILSHVYIFISLLTAKGNARV